MILKNIVENKIKDRKIKELNIEKSSLEKLETRVDMDTYSVEENN